MLRAATPRIFLPGSFPEILSKTLLTRGLMPNRRNPRRNSQAFTVAHNCTSSVPIRNQITSIRFGSLNAHRSIKITTHNLLISHLNLKIVCSSSSSPSGSSTVNNLLTVQVPRILILLQHRMTQTHSSAP